MLASGQLGRVGLARLSRRGRAFPRTERVGGYADAMRFGRITFEPAILGGRACIRGMRTPVSVLVGQIAHGATVEDVLADYPDLEREDVAQALEYAAWLASEQVVVG